MSPIVSIRQVDATNPPDRSPKSDVGHASVSGVSAAHRAVGRSGSQFRIAVQVEPLAAVPIIVTPSVEAEPEPLTIIIVVVFVSV